MNIPAINHTTKRLHNHDVQWIEHPELGTKVACEEGVLWLTQAGDEQDYILMPGEQYATTTRGKLLIEAMREAVVRIG